MSRGTAHRNTPFNSYSDSVSQTARMRHGPTPSGISFQRKFPIKWQICNINMGNYQPCAQCSRSKINMWFHHCIVNMLRNIILMDQIKISRKINLASRDSRLATRARFHNTSLIEINVRRVDRKTVRLSKWIRFDLHLRSAFTAHCSLFSIRCTNIGIAPRRRNIK